MLNFQLTDLEFDSIAQKYKTNDPDNLFNYFDFCHTINSAFTVKGIDKDPVASVKAITKDDTLLARRKYLEMNPEDEEKLADIMQ